MDVERLKEVLDRATPGPWRVRSRVMVSGPAGNTISDVRYKNGEHDAGLIAMAPDLARRVIAAEDLVEALREISTGPDRGTDAIIARAALRKWEEAE
jgi:hypothetical protein